LKKFRIVTVFGIGWAMAVVATNAAKARDNVVQVKAHRTKRRSERAEETRENKEIISVKYGEKVFNVVSIRPDRSLLIPSRRGAPVF
jgi:hypothetical protein